METVQSKKDENVDKQEVRMNRAAKLTVGLFVVALFVAQSANAQLIDHNRRKQRAAAKAGTTVETPAVVKTPAAVSTEKTSKKAAWLTSEPEVMSREDRLFDLDGDGKLQKEESVQMLRNTVSEVANNGRVEVTSEIMKPYDKNGDGYIDTSEIKPLAKDLK